MMAFALLMLVAGDIFRLILWNFFLKRPTKADMLEQILIKSVLQAKENLPATPLSRVIQIFKKKHLDTVHRLFVEFESQVAFRPAEDCFIDSGIRPAALAQFGSARYFNLITFLKTMVMEIFFVTLQSNNWIQITSLCCVQTLYSGFLVYCLFVSRIFLSKYYGAALAIHETCLLAFFALVVALEQQGQSVYNLQGNSVSLQQWVVASLAIAAFSGVVLLLVSQARVVMSRFSGRKVQTSANEEAENTQLLNNIAQKLQEDGYLERLLQGKQHLGKMRRSADEPLGAGPGKDSSMSRVRPVDLTSGMKNWNKSATTNRKQGPNLPESVQRSSNKVADLPLAD